MITIYHNPRCSKSREGVKFLEEKDIQFDVVKYLDSNLSEDDLKLLLKWLNLRPIELVRTKEAVWKEQYKGKELTDKQIIQAMVENPRLIERPIVVNGDKAVVARPTEKINEIL